MSDSPSQDRSQQMSAPASPQTEDTPEEANSSLSLSFEDRSSDSDFDPSEERRNRKTRKMTRISSRGRKEAEIAEIQPEIESENPLIPAIESAKDLPESYARRLVLILMQLNYSFNGQSYTQISGEREETIELIKQASVKELQLTAVQLAQRPGVCRICLQSYGELTNLITVDTRKQAFPFQLPEDGPIRAFLAIIQAFGYRNVALHDYFVNSKIGMLCNYISRYDKNCLDAETQQLAKTVLAGLREEFNKKKDEYEGVTRMGIDQEEALEVGRTRENRREAITINYEGTKGQGAKEARRLEQMGKGTEWAIEESKKIK